MRGKLIGRILGAALLAAATLGASGPPAAGAATTDPYAIFDNARKAWGAGAYPRYAEYVAVVSFHKDAEYQRRTWETTEDIRHGLVSSRAFSREERAHPYTPYGINIAVPFLGNLNKVVPSDPIGHVAFAIDQDYGLAPGERRVVSVSGTSAMDAQRSALPVIGHTGTVMRDYEVTLIETLADGQGRQYHLGLRPLRDPFHHRLRELWIDDKTWLPAEAIVDGIGNRPPLSKVSWRIEYRQNEGATYIARETALAPVDYGGAGMLTDVTIAFDEVALSSRISNIGFGLSFSKDVPLGEP
jgi:hypothetical protein